ncbi:helix-turn-helix domain-containing protein [Mucilaginibacter aquatilis]|uniref:Helix-turn-helix domain-containing protein n=1 Tax=Mucilaginibacter aquatilis TaxID=1517760 RepID=A0A6I4IHM4_9SPHI|nr:helix-turn-helix domain-containing protein [Mucilaginibacter aquatilis]MVN93108.1 helix-turn-helix domain-containing protein [Mucilaginibacter aquatilis]
MQHIPVHKLTVRSGIGIEIKHTADFDARMQDVKNLGAHRDDHYIFFMIDSGYGSIMIDFEEVAIHEKSIFYVLPAQVHHKIENSEAEGWFIAVDTMLVPKEYRMVFENQLLLQQPYKLDEASHLHCLTLIKLLYNHFNHHKQSPFYLEILHSLLHSFIGMAACGYETLHDSGKKKLRPSQIMQDFKNILNANFKTEKRPAAYASMLNISESYLNESLKNTTGLPVSYWITNEVILEAKRLLYYSNLNVKQIAHEVGYDDHTYFSRLFKKSTGKTPLAFKATYRK